MGYVTPEELQKAREVDAFSYLKTYMPGELVNLGNGEFCTKTHDSLKLSHGKWVWWSRGFGGHTALDYLVKVEEMSLTSAVRLINGRAGFIPSSPVSKREKPKIMYAPKHNYYTVEREETTTKQCTDTNGNIYYIEETIIINVLHIERKTMSANEAADRFSFDQKQREYLDTLMSRDFDEMWAVPVN